MSIDYGKLAKMIAHELAKTTEIKPPSLQEMIRNIDLAMSTFRERGYQVWRKTPMWDERDKIAHLETMLKMNGWEVKRLTINRDNISLDLEIEGAIHG